MFEKFRAREYPISLLKSVREKLDKVDRQKLLIPKTKLHIQALQLHYPHLFHEKYSTPPSVDTKPSSFVILPFYKNIPGLKKKVKVDIWKMLLKCKSPVLRKVVLDLNVQVVYTIPNAMSKFLTVKSCT